MSTVEREIIKFDGENFEIVNENIVEELALTIVLNDHEVITLMTIGLEEEELAIGLLRSEGFLSRRAQLKNVELSEGVVKVSADVDMALVTSLSKKRTATSGCGKGISFGNTLETLALRPYTGDILFSPEAITLRMKELEAASLLYKKTGGVHNTALANEEKLLFTRTDIGRHNAVDMLGGRVFLDELDASKLALFVSGRISSDILRKTAAMGVGLIVSRSAPTSLAIVMADKLGVTVVGYARGKRFNVYTKKERLRGCTKA
jgi:FdhD protein